MTGLHVFATLCDQGSPNISAVNTLKDDTRISKLKKNENYDSNYIEAAGQQFVHIYDPPHLIKGIRNNLLGKKLVHVDPKTKEVKTARWDVIERVYNMNPPLSKLTEEHVVPSKIKKMRVKYAAQVFSKSVANFIRFATRINDIDPVNPEEKFQTLPKDVSNFTAECLEFFNNLFDSVNGNGSDKLTPLRSVITDKSSHHTFWAAALIKLKCMEFIDPKTNKACNSVKTLKNWSVTIKAFQALWRQLQALEINHLKGKVLNQDALENFFGQIRSTNFRNNNPTCCQFASSFKTLFLNNLASRRSIGANCEVDTFLYVG